MNAFIAKYRTARRYARPVALGLLNLALVGLWYGVLTPKLAAVDLEMRQIRAGNINLRNQVDSNSLALETIDDDRVEFAALRKRGFMAPQNRLGATKLLERLRDKGGLTSIYYEIAPEVVYDDAKTRATGFTIVSTRVVVKMRGLFDADIIDFVQSVIDEFPGQVRPLKLSLVKLAAPTETTLGSLRDGRLVDFIGGEFTFEWNSLRPVIRKAGG